MMLLLSNILASRLIAAFWFTIKCFFPLLRLQWITSRSSLLLSSHPRKKEKKKCILLVPTVLCVLLSGFGLLAFASLRVVEDVTVGLNDVLLLFEVHLEHALDQHKGYATLWGEDTE